jgi:outer membrane lipoprotein-sorting protein
MAAYHVAVVVMLLLVTCGEAAALQLPRVGVGLREVIAAVEDPFIPVGGGGPRLQTVQADFFQRSTIAKTKRELRGDGRMYLQTTTDSQPLKFRFEYYRPARQEIVCNGRILWIYLPENRQVIQSNVEQFFDPRQHNPVRDRGVNFLQGLARISRDFTIVFAQPQSDSYGNYILELRPNRSSISIARLYITVSQDAVLRRVGGLPKTNAPPAVAPEQFLFAILSTTVVDHDGNSTTMEFTNVRVNDILSDMLFDFLVPPGTQLVRPPAGP